jgi:F-type H+-transporting ATPase subunit delta
MSKVSRRVIARTVAAKFLAEPAKRDQWIRALAAYLMENEIAEEADLIANDIAHELYKQGGVLLATVESARPLGDRVKDELQNLLTKATSAKHIELTEKLNPELLGGAVIRTPDMAADFSVRTKLKQLATI